MTRKWFDRGVLLISILTLIGMFIADELFAQYQVGDQVADFTLMTTSGKTRSLSNYRGKIIVLNFFDTL